MRALSSRCHLVLTDRGHTAEMATANVLTGDGVGPMLASALAGLDATLLSWQPRDVTVRGQRGATASYSVRARWADGTETTETMGAGTGPGADGAPIFVAEGTQHVGIWSLRSDPDLPAMGVALDPHSVGALFTARGVSEPVRLDVVAYRPRRRAVIRATAGADRLYVKVVRPDRVESLHRAHRDMHAAGVPVPQSFGWDPRGLAVLDALPGVTLRDSLIRGHALPDPAEIGRVLEAFATADVAVDSVGSRSWLDRVGHYAASVATTCPGVGERATATAHAIASEAGIGERVLVHGDFYDSQLLVSGGRICGILDLDTMRVGDRLDDLGCLLGHVSVLAMVFPQRAAAINSYGAALITHLERHVDGADLRYRAAAVVMSLATGPHRTQASGWAARTEQIVALSERWLHSARRARGRRR